MATGSRGHGRGEFGITVFGKEIKKRRNKARKGVGCRHKKVSRKKGE
jgi:hypothetical protein